MDPEVKKSPPLELLSEQLRAACKKHGISGVEIFGSLARGEATKDSDLDLIIEFTDPKRKLTFSDLLQIQEDFSSAVGMEVEIVTKEDFQKITNPFLLLSVNRDRRQLLPEGSR